MQQIVLASHFKEKLLQLTHITDHRMSYWGCNPNQFGAVQLTHLPISMLVWGGQCISGPNPPKREAHMALLQHH